MAIVNLIILSKNATPQPFYWTCQINFYWFSSKTCCAKMLLNHLHCSLALPHHTLNLAMTLMCQNDKLPFWLEIAPHSHHCFPTTIVVSFIYHILSKLYHVVIFFILSRHIHCDILSFYFLSLVPMFDASIWASTHSFGFLWFLCETINN